MEVISRDIVKPSSRILKKVKLSYLDQLIPPAHIPIVFFYQADESNGLTTSNQAQISQHIKHSLSNTLTLFYPLAGRLETDNLVIDCNDAGVEFIEARVRARLLEAINDPSMEELKQYTPIDPVEGPLFNVQITFFDCGGIALGVSYLHLIADCHSIMKFLNAWAATCRGEPEFSQSVSFDLAHYFPAREISGSYFLGQNLISKNEKFPQKRFVFNKEILAHLKQDVVSSSGSRVKDPTRVELISTFIWKNFLEVAKLRNPKSTKTFGAVHAVNLRGRKSPSHLLENVFGNCIMLAFAFADTTKISSNFQVEEFHDLVSKLRSSIRKIDNDYITESQTGNNYVNDYYKSMSLFPTEWIAFSSWTRFSPYEVDYGFGNPVWFCNSLPLKNAVIFVSSKSGENIEAWVNMEQDNLEMLETQINRISSSVKDVES